MTLAELMRASREKIYVEEQMLFQDFLHIDNALPVHEELDSDWENNLIQSMRDRQEKEESDAEADADNDEIKDDSVMTHKETLLCIDQLILFFLSKQLPQVISVKIHVYNRPE